MIGASSAFNTPDRDVRVYPHAPYWTLSAADGGPGAVNDLSPTGVTSITWRCSACCVVGSRRSLSSSTPSGHSRSTTTRDSGPTAGRVDPAVPPLFGQPSARWPHNRVFPTAAYREVVSAWQDAKRAGRPLVASTRVTVEPNVWWGIEGGWELSVCWVYNDRVPTWEAALRDEVRRVLPLGADATPDAALARFPHYRTVGENTGALTRLTPIQANLLAELAGWGVLESGDTLQAVLAGC